MDLSFTAAEEAFRGELRAWLREHVPRSEPAAAALEEDVRRLRDWQRALHAGGWVGIHWPRAYGG
ncbi:MAG: acyl-CoA dehydrogenase, partial [Deltaproteobacteria bacterium]